MIERLTSEDYKIAEANGISRKTARRRFDMGWEVEEAITKPVRKTSPWSDWKETALSNGINVHVFSQRVRKGMPPNQAATVPVDLTKSHKGRKRRNGEGV